ncbi:hypothetical protein ACQ3G6_09275 [Allorhizobium undicola]
MKRKPAKQRHKPDERPGEAVPAKAAARRRQHQTIATHRNHQKNAGEVKPNLVYRIRHEKCATKGNACKTGKTHQPFSRPLPTLSSLRNLYVVPAIERPCLNSIKPIASRRRYFLCLPHAYRPALPLPFSSGIKAPCILANARRFKTLNMLHNFYLKSTPI